MLNVDIKVFKNITNNYDYILKKTLISVGDLIISEANRAFRERKFNNINWESTVLESKSTGKLVNSLKQYLSKDSIEIISDLLYSKIHNEGGKIKVTEKMKRFFWSRYYSTKNEFWKNAALTKKKEIVIPKRMYLDITNDIIKFSEQELIKNFNKLISGGTF